MAHPQAHENNPRAQPALSPETEACIRACLETAKRCLEARSHCSGRGGRLADPQLLSLLLDCAEASELAARWLQRGSVFHPDGCALCATICKSTEDACARLLGEAPLQACAEACRRCFDTCLRLGQNDPMLTH